MLRSLKHQSGMSLVIVMAVAVATSVLVGALLVGDSMRGSLRNLTLNRLGNIDYALTGLHYFREELAAELRHSPGFSDFFSDMLPFIMTNGSAREPSSGLLSSQVNVYGVDPSFASWFPGWESQLDMLGESEMTFAPAVLNRRLADELEVKSGDQVLLYLEAAPEVPKGSVLGNRDADRLVETLRVEVVQVLPDSGLGQFGVQLNSLFPANVFLPLGVLQSALAQNDRVNGLIASASGDRVAATVQLDTWLSERLTLEDYGLRLERLSNVSSLESDQLVLSPAVEEAAIAALGGLDAAWVSVITYLANTISTDSNEIPYSTVSSLSSPESWVETMQLVGGDGPPALGSNDIYLNEWAARDLGAEVGEAIELTYYVVGPGEALVVERGQFILSGVLAMTSLAGESSLTPDIPGVEDAQRMGDWDPPIPIDLSRIRAQDEQYWETYRATPKAFLAFDTARDLWQSRFGALTSIRIAPRVSDGSELSASRLAQALLAELKPEMVGLTFRDVQAEALDAADGSTDFGSLFIGFSLFLIFSALLIVALLFRLFVERRSREIGIRLAVGYPNWRVCRSLLLEGAMLAFVGGVLGLGGALGYGRLIVLGLSTWWSSAVSAVPLELHTQNSSLLIGLGLAWLTCMAAVYWGIRIVRLIPVPELLQGRSERNMEESHGRLWSRWITFLSLIGVVALLAIALKVGIEESAPIFFGIGGGLLTCFLSLFFWRLRSARRVPSGTIARLSLFRLASRRGSRNPTRSFLSVCLVSSAAFVIVAVSSTQHYPGAELQDRNSGSGGFAWVGESKVAIHANLDDRDSKLDLGISEEDSALLESVNIHSLRLLPGQDISCLNPLQPRKPRIVGVTPSFVERGGFGFQATLPAGENPWELLEEPIEGGAVIPAFGDANSVRWILHSGLGEDIEIQNEQGEEIRLRIVGLLHRSLFQSELLISEEHFLGNFPSRSGYAFFLLEDTGGKASQASEILERSLFRFGWDGSSVGERLARFFAVENTYLQTFHTLGGLGLVLGTIGLGIILVRNAIDQKGELATLRAFGFRRSRLALLIFGENLVLLFLGLLIGSISAIVAVTPHLSSQSEGLPWAGLVGSLFGILCVGSLAGAAAVHWVLKMPLLASLRTD